MLLDDLVDDRQAQAAAIDAAAQRPVERLQHQAALGLGDARPGVLDLQHHHLAKRVGHDPRRHRAAGRRVLQTVVHQVTDQLAHQQRLAQQPGMLGQDQRLALVGPFVAQIDTLVHRLGHEVAHRFARQLRQVHFLRRPAGTFLVFGPGHRQQLVDHVGSALAGVSNLLQRAFECLRVMLASVDLALRQLGLHPQPGQRGFELVRGVGQKMLLAAHRTVQPGQQIVHRADQRRHLFGYIVLAQRRQVMAFALSDALLQLVERLDAPGQRQPDQQHRQRQHHELRHDHAFDDLGGQARALVQRLGHLHQRRRLTRAAAGRQPEVSDTHSVAVHLVVAVTQLLARRCGLVGHRQITVAGDEFAACAQHLEIHLVGVVGPHHLGRHLGQAQTGLAFGTGGTGGARLARRHLHLARHGAGHLGQVTVKRSVGDVLRHQPGQRHAQRPQQQQRRQHPIEDLAKQRALLAGRGSGGGLHH